jgi:SAM-dependent methyltransferase
VDELAARQFVELERTHWWFEGRRRVFFDVITRAVRGRGPVRSLDVGCGAGGMLAELTRLGPAVGLEISRELIHSAHERGFPRLLVGSAERLPVARGAFDLVTAFDCIEHLDDDVGALASFFQAVKPGGLLFVSVPAWQFLYAENDRVAMHKRRYRRSALTRKLRAAGFDVVKSSYVNAWLFPLIVPAVLALKFKQRFLKPKSAPAETNLSYAPPRWINATLGAIFSSERFVLRLTNFRLGHSLIALARKPERAP